MEMVPRPPKASLNCPPQVLILEETDFPVRISSAVLRARQSSVFSRDGKIFWVILPDKPEEVQPLYEPALRAELARLNNNAQAIKQSP